MTRWISQFDCPANDWLPMVMGTPDGAEHVARQVADREGEGVRDYAEAVYPELKVIWENMRERQAAPVAVCVPVIPRSARPLVPASAYVQGWRCTPEDRVMETLTDLVSQPKHHRLGKPDVSVVELPAGPTCRVQEVLLNDVGDDGRRFIIEQIDHFVLPPACQEGMFKFTIPWSDPTLGPGISHLADEMAFSLSICSDETTNDSA
ncbi:hypothetical protein [Streptomyces litchfieldiae]|uniref:Uncharacterized protein n=1 Tax=Streptomyces litchfieldiae TaxID=3075543 RepID=A0ABU2MJ70_9ACTN|nr:hypothetical protein [Streptomyces sp. DSM 44938]MDT0341521.1 hypothetical protein [Streptomyces sp. DSM 44938]